MSNFKARLQSIVAAQKIKSIKSNNLEKTKLLKMAKAAKQRKLCASLTLSKIAAGQEPEVYEYFNVVENDLDYANYLNNLKELYKQSDAILLKAINKLKEEVGTENVIIEEEYEEAEEHDENDNIIEFYSPTVYVKKNALKGKKLTDLFFNEIIPQFNNSERIEFESNDEGEVTR